MRDSIKMAISLIKIPMIMTCLLLVAIFGFLIILGNRSLESTYEYETFEGERGVALYCYPINRSRQNPYCVLEDRTQVFNIKKFKKINEGKEWVDTIYFL